MRSFRFPCRRIFCANFGALRRHGTAKDDRNPAIKMALIRLPVLRRQRRDRHQPLRLFIGIIIPFNSNNNNNNNNNINNNTTPLR